MRPRPQDLLHQRLVEAEVGEGREQAGEARRLDRERPELRAARCRQTWMTAPTLVSGNGFGAGRVAASATKAAIVCRSAMWSAASREAVS